MKLIKFENDIKMYSYLEEKLNNGYNIIDTIGLSLIIEKDNKKELLTTNNDADLTNLEALELPKINVLYPDYTNTLLNIDSGIRSVYGYSSNYLPDKAIVDKKYKHIIVLILDGLGTHILNLLPDDSFLRRYYLKNIHAIYPSTTAAATTAIKSGLSPLETGWTGWENYFKEVNRDLVLFTGVNYFTDESTLVNPFKYLPYKIFYSDMNCKGNIIEPDFSKTEHPLSYVLEKSLMGLKNGDEIQYVYHPEPDSMLHKEGLSSNVIDYLKSIDKRIEDYSKKLPLDTLLIISADHGHINVSPLEFHAYNFLTKMLERKPANDSRCIVFKVKNEYMDIFPSLFDKCFKNVYKLYKSSDAIKLGFFGKGIVHERIHDFLGDFVAVAINKYYFNYKGPGDIVFKSHHAGITEYEMNIPLIRFVK